MSVFVENGDGTLRLAADWNALYQGEADPWGQSGIDKRLAAYYDHSRRRLANALTQIRAHGEGLEVGCGHGHALRALRLHGPWVKWQGADASEVAVEQAAMLYPKMKFRVLDITGECETKPEFDVVLLNEVWWYLLHAIDVAVTNAHAMVRPGGALVIAQGFLKEQRYGREIADGFWGAAHLMQARYGNMMRLIRAEYDESEGLPLQQGILAFRVPE